MTWKLMLSILVMVLINFAITTNCSYLFCGSLSYSYYSYSNTFVEHQHRHHKHQITPTSFRNNLTSRFVPRRNENRFSPITLPVAADDHNTYTTSTRTSSTVHMNKLNTSDASSESQSPRQSETNQNMIIEKLQSQASKYHKQKKMLQAIAKYDEAINIIHPQPDSPTRSSVPTQTISSSLLKIYQRIVFERALCLSEIGYIDDAVVGFQHAINIKVANMLSSPSFYSKEEHNDSKDQSHNRPGREEMYLANILLDGRGEKETALNIYQQYGPESSLVMLAGICLDSLGRHDEARECYHKALQLKDGDADTTTMIYLCINLTRRLQENGYNNDGDVSADADKSVIDDLMTKIQSLSTSAHLASSWKYIFHQTNVWHLPSVHFFTYDMMQLAMDNVKLEHGLILEFGVYFGKTIRMMANYFPNETIHGFDTFEGLPADWFNTKKGSYSTGGALPSVPQNVKFYKGLFSDTLPIFLEEETNGASAGANLPIRLMNIDCDMYDSTKDIFDVIHSRIRSGTIIVFDEYVVNPNWKEDEYKAFQEACEEFGWQYEYLGISMTSQQAVVRIL